MFTGVRVFDPWPNDPILVSIWERSTTLSAWNSMEGRKTNQKVGWYLRWGIDSEPRVSWVVQDFVHPVGCLRRGFPSTTRIRGNNWRFRGFAQGVFPAYFPSSRVPVPRAPTMFRDIQAEHIVREPLPPQRKPQGMTTLKRWKLHRRFVYGLAMLGCPTRKCHGRPPGNQRAATFRSSDLHGSLSNPWCICAAFSWRRVGSEQPKADSPHTLGFASLVEWWPKQSTARS